MTGIWSLRYKRLKRIKLYSPFSSYLTNNLIKNVLAYKKQKCSVFNIHQFIRPDRRVLYGNHFNVLLLLKCLQSITIIILTFYNK